MKHIMKIVQSLGNSSAGELKNKSCLKLVMPSWSSTDFKIQGHYKNEPLFNVVLHKIN